MTITFLCALAAPPASAAAAVQLFHWNMHWQCSALGACRAKALALVQSKLDAGFDLVSLVELENFDSLPPTPNHELLMTALAQNPASRLDDSALLWYNTKTFTKEDGGPIFFGGITKNSTAPVGSQGFYVGNWAVLQRISGSGRKCLVVQGHFSHDLQQSGAALLAAVPALGFIVQGSMDIVVLADTNDYAKTDQNIQGALGWTATDPAPKPVTDLTESTCCWEIKGCATGCCWGATSAYDKFLVRLADAADATQAVDVGADLEAAGLGDEVLSAWGCANSPGAGEMHKPVQVVIRLADGGTGGTGGTGGVGGGGEGEGEGEGERGVLDTAVPILGFGLFAGFVLLGLKHVLSGVFCGPTGPSDSAVARTAGRTASENFSLNGNTGKGTSLKGSLLAEPLLEPIA